MHVRLARSQRTMDYRCGLANVARFALMEQDKKNKVGRNFCVPVTVLVVFNCNRTVKNSTESADSALQRVEASPIVI